MPTDEEKFLLPPSEQDVQTLQTPEEILGLEERFLVPLSESTPAPTSFRPPTRYRQRSEPGFFSQAGLGVATGTFGALETTGRGIQAVSDVFGIEGGFDFAADLGQYFQERGEDLPLPTASRLEDIDSPEDFRDWLAFNLGQVGPYIGATVGAGALAAGGAVALGAGGAAAGAGVAGATAISYLMNTGEVYANLRAEGYDAPGAAAIAGIPMAVLDVVVPVKILGRVFWKGAKQSIVGAVASSALGEAVTEAGQEAIGAGAEAIVTGRPYMTGELASRMLNAFASGGLGGGVFGGGAEALGRLRDGVPQDIVGDDIPPLDPSELELEELPQAPSVGQPPRSGLVVANVGADGKTYYGIPGDLHFSLSERYPFAQRGEWQTLGFAGPDGKVLTREEASSVAEVAESELEAMALRGRTMRPSTIEEIRTGAGPYVPLTPGQASVGEPDVVGQRPVEEDARTRKYKEPQIDLSDGLAFVPAADDGDFVFADKVDAQQRFTYFDEKLFGGTLGVAGWNYNAEDKPTRKGVVGSARHETQDIVLGNDVGYTPLELDALLLHEMVHAELGVAKRQEKKSHGTNFKRRARELEDITGVRGIAGAQIETGYASDRARANLERKGVTSGQVYAQRLQRVATKAKVEAQVRQAAGITPGFGELVQAFSTQMPAGPISMAAGELVLEGDSPILRAAIQVVKDKKYSLGRIKKLLRTQLRDQYQLSAEESEQFLQEKTPLLERIYKGPGKVIVALAGQGADGIAAPALSNVPSGATVVLANPQDGIVYEKDGEGQYIVETANAQQTADGIAHVTIEEALRGMTEGQRQALSNSYENVVKDLPSEMSFGEWLLGNIEQDVKLSNLSQQLRDLYTENPTAITFSNWLSRLQEWTRVNRKGELSDTPAGVVVEKEGLASLLRKIGPPEKDGPDNDGLEPSDKEDLNGSLDWIGVFSKKFLTMLQIADQNKHIKVLQTYMETNRNMERDRHIFERQAMQRDTQVGKLSSVQQHHLSSYLYRVAWMSIENKGRLSVRQKEKLQKQMEPGTIELADAILQDYKDALDVLEQEELASAEQQNPDPETLAVVKQAIAEDVARMRARDYVPFTRWGKYTLIAYAKSEGEAYGRAYKKGEIVRFETFTNARERKHRIKEFTKLHPKSLFTVGMGKLTDGEYGFLGMNPTMIDSLGATAGLTPEQVTKMKDYATKHSLGNSFRQHRLRREGIAGFVEDGRRAYITYFSQLGNHVSRLRWRHALADNVATLAKQANQIQKNGGNATKRWEIFQHMSEHQRFVMEAKGDWAAVRAFAFRWYFTGVPKQIMLNLTQVPLATWGFLTARHGSVAGTKQLALAYKDIFRAIRNPEKLSPEDSAAMQWALDQNTIQENLTSTMAGAVQGNLMADQRARNTFTRSVGKVLDMGIVPFAWSEQVNRVVTFLAAYRLNEGLDEGARREAARDAVERTQGVYSKWNRFPIARGKAAVFFIFKTYMQNMIYLMATDKGRVRMWMTMLAMAGMMGLPGAEDVADLIDYLVRKFGGKHSDIRKEIREIVGTIGVAPDLVMHGSARYGLGFSMIGDALGLPIPQFDLSGSISLGRVVPGIGPFLGQQGSASTRIARGAGEFGGPVAGQLVSFANAIYSDEPNTWRRYERVMPPLIKNISQSYRAFEEEAYTDKQGRELLNIDPQNVEQQVELIFKAMGFPVARERQKSEGLWARKMAAQYWLTRRSLLFNSYGFAMIQKDRETMARIMQEIRAYNKARPHGMPGISGQDMKRALTQRTKNRRMIEAGLPTQKSQIPLYREYSVAYPEPEEATK